MPNLLENKPRDYRQIAASVRPVAAFHPPTPGPSLKLNTNVPTITLPRYHIADSFPKEKTHEAHFPLPRDELGRFGAPYARHFHRRAGFRGAFGARGLGRPAGIRRDLRFWRRADLPGAVEVD